MRLVCDVVFVLLIGAVIAGEAVGAHGDDVEIGVDCARGAVDVFPAPWIQDFYVGAGSIDPALFAVHGIKFREVEFLIRIVICTCAITVGVPVKGLIKHVRPTRADRECAFIEFVVFEGLGEELDLDFGFFLCLFGGYVFIAAYGHASQEDDDGHGDEQLDEGEGFGGVGFWVDFHG